ncbi:CPBP family glutamic-type intramembrane protease [Lapidilactobacillus bayanensis]|uniref:CPBP family glutamic-type intramembrane protease n=1 Tax=Lapidilactobacillus bayanensis TaxID=2485998 RepID=UPI000F79A2A5|nr:CPBP family intramembrane glutamic endopeptidase [Lapidilactobacillus bayanensis]
MRSPASFFGNLVRYLFFAALVLLAIWLKDLAFADNKVSGTFVILFLALAVIGFWFLIRQFNLEQQYFAVQPNSRQQVLSSASGFITLMLLIIGALNLLIAWLQVAGKLPALTNTAGNFDLNHIGFWLNILMVGIILPVLEQLLATGFLFNYAFRGSSPVIAVVGILVSATLFTILQFQPAIMPAFIQFWFGLLFAMSYLYTRRIEVPICLNIFSAILMIILA